MSVMLPIVCTLLILEAGMNANSEAVGRSASLAQRHAQSSNPDHGMGVCDCSKEIDDNKQDLLKA